MDARKGQVELGRSAVEDEKPTPRAIRKGTPQVVEFVASSRAASNLVGELAEP